MENNADSFFVKGVGVIDEMDYARITVIIKKKLKNLSVYIRIL